MHFTRKEPFTVLLNEVNIIPPWDDLQAPEVVPQSLGDDYCRRARDRDPRFLGSLPHERLHPITITILNSSPN